MKRLLLFLILILQFSICFPDEIPFKLFQDRLADGTSFQLQFCTENIVRIRTSPDGLFPETLMERYGIIQTRWPEIKIKQSKRGAVLWFTTDSIQLQINKNTGVFQLQKSNGEVLVSSIRIEKENAKQSKLLTSLHQLFKEEIRTNNIIGDVSAKEKQNQKAVSQNDSTISILNVTLNETERFYGLGSACRGWIQHRGHAARIWADYQRSEAPVPFIMSTTGWGLFNNTTYKNYFDVGRFDKNKLLVTTPSTNVDFYLIAGSSLKDVLGNYTQITGKPYLLPRYAYGLAFGGNTMEDQLDMMNNAVRFRDEEIPCDLFWIEPQWMSTYYDFSTAKNWNLKKFPAEPFWEVNKPNKYEAKSLFISKLHGLGFKLALWLCIDHDLSFAEEDKLAKKQGKPDSGMEHWFDHLTKFMDQGVDGFKLDPAKTLDEHPGVNYYNGRTDSEMHNLNQVLLPKQMNETFHAHKGIRSFHHYCGGYAGTQHWGASTSGDNGGGKNALYDQLNLGMSGFMNTSADVLEGVDDIKAGIHLGFFLPWVQINSWYSLHHPWYMATEDKNTFRFYAQLRNQLAPYIYSTALEGSQKGLPILRAMPLMFPDDRNVDDLIYQFMFGENLLTNVFSDSIYLPKGNWINYWNGEKYSGGKTVHCKIPEQRGGLLFVKAGAIIPMKKLTQYIEEEPLDTLILKVFPEGNSSYTYYEDDGISFEYEDGTIASTTFNCKADKQTIELLIEPTQGSYKNMPEIRIYEFEIHSELRPKSVIQADGSPLKWTYSSNKILRFCLTSPTKATTKLTLAF